MSRLGTIFSILVLTLVTGCAGQPAPTVVPPTATQGPTEIPIATPTQIPTLAPLPTEIPRDSSPNTVTTDGPTASLRIVHAAPGTASVDVYLGSQTIAFGVRYLRASGQAEVAAQEYTLRILPAGSAADATALYETPLSLQQDQSLTIALLPFGEELRTQVFFEDTRPLDADQTRITVLNLLPTGPAITILQPSLIVTEDSLPEPAFPSIQFGEQSDPFELPSGETTLSFDGLDLEYEMDLRPRRSYTLILAGDFDAPTVIETDVSVPSRARTTVVNLSQQIGPVDIYFEGTRIFEGLDFKFDREAESLIARNYTVQVFSSDADPATIEPLLTQQVTLSPNDENFLFLMGPANDLTLMPYQNNAAATDTAETRITIINAVSTTPLLQETRSSDTPFDVPYAQAVTRFYTSQQLTFEFITPASDTEEYNVVELIPDYIFEEGSSYLILVTGQGTDNSDPMVMERSLGIDARHNAEVRDTRPRFHVVNATRDEIQVIVDGTIVDSNLTSFANTTLQRAEPGEVSFRLLDADTLRVRHENDVLLETNRDYTLVFVGDENGRNPRLIRFQTEYPQSASLSEANIRLLNVSPDVTRPLSFSSMLAVQPRQRLSNIIEGPGETFRIPPEVPRTYEGLRVIPGETSEFFPVFPTQVDFHVFDPNDERLFASVYDVTIGEGGFYDVVVIGGGEITPYEAFLVEHPTP